MNVDFVALIKSGFLPGWGIFALLLVAVIRSRAANKTADEARDAGQYQRLLAWAEKMEARVQALEDEVKKCHGEMAEALRERDAALAKVAQLEAIQLGMGLGRQRAAEVVASERAEQRDKTKREGK